MSHDRYFFISADIFSYLLPEQHGCDRGRRRQPRSARRVLPLEHRDFQSCCSISESAPFDSWRDPRAFNALLSCCQPCRSSGAKVNLANRAKAINHWAADGHIYGGSSGASRRPPYSSLQCVPLPKRSQPLEVSKHGPNMMWCTVVEGTASPSLMLQTSHGDTTKPGCFGE